MDSFFQGAYSAGFSFLFFLGVAIAASICFVRFFKKDFDERQYEICAKLSEKDDQLRHLTAMLDTASQSAKMRSMRPTLLDRVRGRLLPLKHPDLRRIGDANEISYDTLRRIKDPSYDPSFSRVQKLAVYFKFWRP